MPVIHRNVTRAILETTEVTHKTRSPNKDVLQFELTAAQKLYVGFHGKFSTRYFYFKTPNTNPTAITVKSWDGNGYVPVEDIVDQTLGFTRSGFLSWQNVDSWKAHKQSPADDRELFWTEITVGNDLSLGTELEALINLFCDEDLFRAYYPELITDTRYLPVGRTDFIEQYWAAKDSVVLRLKQDQAIEDESQIIDINEVALAAVHKTAHIILAPIARDEGDEATVSAAFNAFNNEINKSAKNFDWNKSGKIDEGEKGSGTVYVNRGL